VCLFVYYRNCDHENVEAACKLTLEHLGLDYLDLYLIHWPSPLKPGAKIGSFSDEDRLRYSATGITETWKVCECGATVIVKRTIMFLC